MQPMWGISVNGSDPDKQDKILPIVRDVLSNMVRDGLDKTLLTGALNRTEFILREADFVGRPKGLIYGIRCMDTWLYDMDPLAALSYEGSWMCCAAASTTATLKASSRNTSSTIPITP